MLAEVLIAVAVVAIGLSALASAIPVAGAAVSEGARLSTATFLAAARLEEIRASTWGATPAVDRLGLSDSPLSPPQSGDTRTFPDEPVLPGPYGGYSRQVRILDCGAPPGCGATTSARLRQVTVTVAYLPLALIALALLSSLILGLSVMSATEPTIAANQLRTAQARALAEGGIEQALWALANPDAPGGLPDPLPTTVPAPYDGSRLISLAAGGVTLGGFRIAVTAGAARNERDVLSVGWTPTDDSADARPKSHQRVAATLWRLRVPAEAAPCALCVLGALDIADQATVDARGDRRCGAKSGAWSSRETTVASSAKIWGADGNDTANEAGDYAQAQPADEALAWIFTDADLLAIKRLARARGSYYRGSVVFT